MSLVGRPRPPQEEPSGGVPRVPLKGAERLRGPGRPRPDTGLRSTSASLFCPQTPPPPPSSPPLPPDWPLLLTVAWMRLGVWRSRNRIGPSASLWPRRRWAAGLAHPHCGVRNWASDPFCVGHVQQEPRVCRSQGGGGRSSPGSPRVGRGLLRAPRGEALSAPSGTPRNAGYWRPPCPLHAALQGPAGQEAGAQPCLARRPGSPSACSGLSLRAMPDSGQGFCEEGHLGRLARLPHTAQAHLGSGGLEIKFSP